MSSEPVTIFVCISCRDSAEPEQRPGAILIDALRTRLVERSLALRVESVDCLAVCKRPATVALSGHDKWTYVLGDLSADAHVDQLIDSAQRFAESENGIVSWNERPACFRKGVISRTPPTP